MTQSATRALVCRMNPAAVDHSATRCRERRLLTNARIEWMAAIKYAATAASSKDRIGEGIVSSAFVRGNLRLTLFCVWHRVELQESKRGVGHPEMGPARRQHGSVRSPAVGKSIKAQRPRPFVA